jgi:predicted CxxxxCH...CXXCH cytochrome family protein
VHAALNGTITCSICHQGAGSGTIYHINGVANVFIDTAYNAKTGTASYNAGTATCSLVSCHGGQTTPNWGTGTIDVNTQCTSCHASGTAQYNSYNSGEHNRHVNNENVGCTVCHNTTQLAANHFTALNTTAMEGPAAATINASVNYNGNSCNPSAGGMNGCHGSENW